MTGILLGVAVISGAALGEIGIGILVIIALIGLQLGWLRPVVAVLLLVAAIGGFVRIGQAPTAPAEPSWAAVHHAFYAHIASGPTSDGSTQRFVAIVKPATQTDNQQTTACVSGPVLPRLARGDQVYLVGSTRTAGEASPSYAAYLIRKGCAISVSAYEFQPLVRGSGFWDALDRYREHISERVQRAIPGDAGALVTGLSTGDDSSLSPGIRDAFYLTGTSHVTAVSGSNLALFIGFFAAAGAAAGWMRRLSWQLATISVVWIYVGLIGFGAPAVRSAMVATLAMMAVRVGRKPDMLTLSAMVAAIDVLLRPEDLFSLAFRLSTASAIGLLFALGGTYPASFGGWIWKASISSAAANLATAPFLLATVGLPFPVRAIVTNIAIAPMVELLFPLSAMLSLLASMGDQVMWLAAPVELLSKLCLGTVRLCARMPGSTMAAGALPMSEWAFSILVVGAMCFASAECRGGIWRIARRWNMTNLKSRQYATAVVASTVLGASISWLTR